MSIKTRIQDAKKDVKRLERKYHVRENVAFFGGVATVATASFALGVLYGVPKGYNVAIQEFQNGDQPLFGINTAMEKAIQNMKPGEEYKILSLVEGLPTLTIKVKPN